MPCHTCESQISLRTWFAVNSQRKIVGLFLQLCTIVHNHAWPHSHKKPFTAFLEPKALVHPRSRIATVGGIWFSVWKATPSSSTFWTGSYPRNAQPEKSGSILCSSLSAFFTDVKYTGECVTKKPEALADESRVACCEDGWEDCDGFT